MKRDEVLAEALKTLRAGGTILYPTDTVWGLGCDATNPEAVAKIYAIKRRSEAKSLVLLAADLDMVAKRVGGFPIKIQQMIQHCCTVRCTNGRFRRNSTAKCTALL